MRKPVSTLRRIAGELKNVVKEVTREGYIKWNGRGAIEEAQDLCLKEADAIERLSREAEQNKHKRF
jgi:hypothetical protein